MVKKKFPKSVSVLGQEFLIHCLDSVVDEGETSENHGMTHSLDYWIKISNTKNLTDEAKESTLLHETLHAALGVSGLSELLDDKLEEAIVTCLENALRSLYKRDYV